MLLISSLFSLSLSLTCSQLDNNSAMQPVASLDRRDVSRCGQLHSVVPMSDELLALVFRNGHVLLQRTRDRQHTRSEVVVTFSSSDDSGGGGGKRSSSGSGALCVEYCSAISSSSLLLLVREASSGEVGTTYKVVIVEARGDKKKGGEWRQTHTKLMSSSDAMKISDSAVVEDVAAVVACCYNAKSRLLNVICKLLLQSARRHIHAIVFTLLLSLPLCHRLYWACDSGACGGGEQSQTAVAPSETEPVDPG